MSEVCPEQIAQAKRKISRILIFIKHYDIRGDHKTNKKGLLTGARLLLCSTSCGAHVRLVPIDCLLRKQPPTLRVESVKSTKKKKQAILFCLLFPLIRDRGRIRTLNPQSRNLIFYPVELRGRSIPMKMGIFNFLR